DPNEYRQLCRRIFNNEFLTLKKCWLHYVRCEYLSEIKSKLSSCHLECLKLNYCKTKTFYFLIQNLTNLKSLKVGIDEYQSVFIAITTPKILIKLINLRLILSFPTTINFDQLEDLLSITPNLIHFSLSQGTHDSKYLNIDCWKSISSKLNNLQKFWCNILVYDCTKGSQILFGNIEEIQKQHLTFKRMSYQRTSDFRIRIYTQ
ncbi:unnamed protein product, partial [Didymodactylos carnosus]